MKREMSDMQYGILYKMETGWRLRSALDSRPWLARNLADPHPRMEVTRFGSTTLDVLSKKLWVIAVEHNWPITTWELTGKGYAALQSEQIRRGAVLKGMELHPVGTITGQ